MDWEELATAFAGPLTQAERDRLTVALCKKMAETFGGVCDGSDHPSVHATRDERGLCSVCGRRPIWGGDAKPAMI